MSTRGWKRGMALLFSAVLAGSTAAAQSRDGMTPAKVTLSGLHRSVARPVYAVLR